MTDEDRYMGREDLTDIDQVARYLRDNYVDAQGDELTMGVATAICNYEEMWEWIQNGVANRSFVYYIGDMIAERAKLDERDDSDYDYARSWHATIEVTVQAVDASEVREIAEEMLEFLVDNYSIAGSVTKVEEAAHDEPTE